MASEALSNFIGVSKKHPRSAIAQSAELTMKFQKKPDLFKEFDALATDMRAWQHVQASAERAHKLARRKNPDLKAPEPPEFEEVVRVLNGESEYMTQLKPFPRDVLRAIVNLRKQVHTEDEYAKRIHDDFGIKLVPL